MVFEFKAEEDRSLLEAFAEFAGTAIHRGVITLPENLGTGYIRGVKLGNMRLMLHCFRLKSRLEFRRLAAADARHHVTFTFHMGSPVPLADLNATDPGNERLPSVKITSANIDYESLIPADSDIRTIIIVIHLSDLIALFDQEGDQTILQHILTEDKPYLYEELLSPAMQAVGNEMFDASVPDELLSFFYRVKAQELICLFFAALLQRQALDHYPVNAADIRRVYQVRDTLIADLSVVPKMSDLAAGANMSESKLKRLFKQIFGTSVYTYYLSLRMKHAAYLIAEQKLSVSEAGYRLGFSNLSHFSRLFERYHGLKPKKFSALQRSSRA